MSRPPEDYYRRQTVKRENDPSLDDYRSALSSYRDAREEIREHSLEHQRNNRRIKEEHVRDDTRQSKSREKNHSRDSNSRDVIRDSASTSSNQDSQKGGREGSFEYEMNSRRIKEECLRDASKYSRIREHSKDSRNSHKEGRDRAVESDYRSSKATSAKHSRGRRSRSLSNEQRPGEEIRHKSHKHKHKNSLHEYKIPRKSRREQQDDEMRESKRPRGYHNDKQVAAVPPWTRKSMHNSISDSTDDITMIECSNNKMRTMKRRLAKILPQKTPEVVIVDIDPPTPPPALAPNVDPIPPVSPNLQMPQLTAQTSEQLTMPIITKFDTEYMIPDDNVDNVDASGMPYELPAPVEFKYEPQRRSPPRVLPNSTESFSYNYQAHPEDSQQVKTEMAHHYQPQPENPGQVPNETVTYNYPQDYPPQAPTEPLPYNYRPQVDHHQPPIDRHPYQYQRQPDNPQVPAERFAYDHAPHIHPSPQVPAENFEYNYQPSMRDPLQTVFFQDQQAEHHEEVERKPPARFLSVSIPKIRQVTAAPQFDVTLQSYDIQAVCRTCSLTFVHSCNHPPSADRTDMFLEPGQLKRCKCSAIFLHPRSCQDAVSKSYVPAQKESGLVKQVDRIHKYECPDCDFKMAIERLKHGSHYFESLTRKDGSLREKGKKMGRELTPMLNAVDEITKAKYPREPPIVLKKNMEMWRCLISQCNQNCCVVYHECPPKSSGDESDENM